MSARLRGLVVAAIILVTGAATALWLFDGGTDSDPEAPPGAPAAPVANGVGPAGVAGASGDQAAAWVGGAREPAADGTRPGDADPRPRPTSSGGGVGAGAATAGAPTATGVGDDDAETALPGSVEAARSGGGAAGRSGGRSRDDGSPPTTDRIAGQVLFTDGSPVAGATVEAFPVRLFDAAATEGRDQARVITAAGGQFDLGELRLGEYDVRVTGPGEQPALTNATVRTGSAGVRLVLGQIREIWVDGYVASGSGEPLGGVLVTAEGLGIGAESAADGRFGFALAAADHRRVPLSLQREGFEPARVGVDPAAADATGVVTVDVALTPAAARLRVTGQVVDTAGQGLPGKSVYLSGTVDGSASKYRATTDANGGFVITDIRNPGVYILSVSAGDGYAGFKDQGFKVPDRGVQGHTITLDPVATGSVTGSMLDALGRPVPNFTLTIQSASAPRETVSVTSDAQGWFSAENVPAGTLRIQSQSFPRFITSGATLAAGEVATVDVLVDQGEQQLSGWATDDAGLPLAGADITLSWLQRDGSLMHESMRQTTTDRTGAFSFTGLGPGARDLLARAPRHQEVRLTGLVARPGEPLRVVLPRGQ